MATMEDDRGVDEVLMRISTRVMHDHTDGTAVGSSAAVDAPQQQVAEEEGAAAPADPFQPTEVAEPEVQHPQSQLVIEVADAAPHDIPAASGEANDNDTAIAAEDGGGVILSIPFDFASSNQIYQSVACSVAPHSAEEIKTSADEDAFRVVDEDEGEEDESGEDGNNNDGDRLQNSTTTATEGHITRDNFFLSFASVAQRVASFLPTEHLVKAFRTVHASCTDAGRIELTQRREVAVKKLNLGRSVHEYWLVDCVVRHYARQQAVAIITSQKGEGTSLITATIVGPGASRYVSYRGETVPVSHVSGKLFATSLTELPLLVDATVLLRNRLSLHIREGIAASPDLAHLLNLPTELSKKAWDREVLVCRLTVTFPFFNRPSGTSAESFDFDSDDSSEGVSVEQRSVVSMQIELPLSSKWRNPVDGAVPVPSIDLSLSKILPPPEPLSRSELLEQTVFVSVMQEGATHVLATGVGPFQLGASLSEVRSVLKANAATAQLEDKFAFCYYGGASYSSGASVGEATERSSRERSARSGASITGLSPSAPADESTLVLHDLLPPNKLQFLIGELRNAQYPRWTHLGWPAEVTLRSDKVLVIIVKAGAGGVASPHDDTMMASVGPTGTRAARSLRQQAQRQKEHQNAVRDSMQTVFAQAADCCRRGDVRGLTTLLDVGKQKLPARSPLINIRSILGQSLAHVAAEHGRQEVIEALVSRGISVALRDANGQLPIHLCASKGYAECIPPLLRGADGMLCIDAQDNAGRTPLICALQNGFLNTALWLTEQGANSLITESAGFSASDFACRLLPTISDICASGNVDAAKLLLSAACDDSPADDCTVAEASAWYTETLKHRLTRGRLLLDMEGVWTISKRKGCIVPNVLRVTAFHCAVSSASLPLVRLLLSRFPKTNILAQDHAGDTPLHGAARCSDPELLITLLEHLEAQGLAMDGLAAQNASGRTPIHEALLRPHGALHVSRILARCQAAPSLYPVERFGAVLVHYLERGTRLSACHFAVAHIHRRTSITPALLAAALAALDCAPTDPLKQAANMEMDSPSPLQAAYAIRFPESTGVHHSQHERRQTTAEGSSIVSLLPSLFVIAVQQGCLETLQLLVDFRDDAINKGGVRWPTEYFGDFAPTDLLRIAFDRHDLQMFKLILQLANVAVRRPTGAKEALQARVNGAVEIGCKSAPLYHVILCSPPSAAWVELVLEHGAVELTLGGGDRSIAPSSPIGSPLAAAYEDEDLADSSILSRLASSIVRHSRELGRSTAGGKPAPLPQAETTWSRFLSDTTSSIRRLRKDGAVARVHRHHACAASCQRQFSEAAIAACTNALRLVCKHLAERADSAGSERARERHVFRRHVVFAALRCDGQQEPFNILQPYFGGTHHVRSDDLMRACNLLHGVNYSVLPGSNDRLRTPSPGSRGIATAASHMSRLLTPATVVAGSAGRTMQSDQSGGNQSASIAALFFPNDAHEFAEQQRVREHQLTVVLHYVQVADVGQLLHEMVLRRYFAAAGTLIRTSAVNAHQRDDSMAMTTTDRPHHSRSVDHRAEHLEIESGVAVVHVAAQFGASSLLKDLVKSGQFLPDEASRGDGWTPLHFASANGHGEVVEILLKLGVSPRSRTRDAKGDNCTPLHLAAQHGHLEVVTRLIDHGAQVDALTGDHRTPLHLACRFGHLVVALALLDCGASIEKVDTLGNTPILLAAQHGHGSLILPIAAKAKKEQLLLSVNSKTKTSIAHYAAWYGSNMPKDLVDRLYAVSNAAVAAAPSSQGPKRPASSGAGAPATRPQTVAIDETCSASARSEEEHFPVKATSLSLSTEPAACPTPSGPSAIATNLLARPGGALAMIHKLSQSPVPGLAHALGTPSSSQEAPPAVLSPKEQTPCASYAPLWARSSAPVAKHRSLQLLARALNVPLPIESSAEEKGEGQRKKGVASPSKSLEILGELFAACTSERSAASDPTLFPELNDAAAAAGAHYRTILSAYQDSPPESCTSVHLFRNPDGRAPHAWLPVHYALANGQSAFVSQLRRLDQSPVPDVPLDQVKYQREEAARREAEARARIVVGVQFPKFEVQVPNSFALEASRVENDVFVPCPPPAPPPQVWHQGYFANDVHRGGIFGLVRMRSSSIDGQEMYDSFVAMSDARVLGTLAWLIKRGMTKEVTSRLCLLQDLNVGAGCLYPTGVPLLCIAAYYGQNETVKVLLAAGADPRHIARLPTTSPRLMKGMTALLAAAHVGHLDVVETLLEHGKCDVDAEDECGNTAVHYAVLRKNFALVKTLLRHGAKIDVKNHCGDTPEDIATALRSRDILKLIQCWSVTSSLMEKDRVADHPPCRTAVEYKTWIQEASVFYKRLDTLHQRDVKITNKEELNSIPTLLYRKLSQRLQTPPARSIESQLIPFWWPEEVKEINLQATFLGDKCLSTLFQFTKLVRNLESLVLSSCQVSNEHVAELCYAIEQHPSLRRIDLSFNRGVSKVGGLKLLALCEVNVNMVGVSLDGTSVDIALQRTVGWQTEANRKTQAMRCEDPTSDVHPRSTPTVTPARKRLATAGLPAAFASAQSSKPGSRMSS